jgi:NAD(P)-dependent dehydrogenase (short-subunit alcohol dehydrogenase family)
LDAEAQIVLGLLGAVNTHVHIKLDVTNMYDHSVHGKPMTAAGRKSFGVLVSDSRRLSLGDCRMSTQVVLITGGLTGIGRAAAVAFAKKGAKVVVAGRRDEAGKALVKELRSLGSEAEFINADVRKEEDIRNAVDKTITRFGRLDVAVNNAATEGQVGPITDQTAESYAATFDTNVLGVLLSMKHEVRVMQKQGSGSIVNISSTYGHEGAAFAAVYVASKHAVEGITKSVALEVVKSGIRVNAVAPGPVDTGMLTRFTHTAENKAELVKQVPMARLGISEEQADAIVFIASDAASFITGHILNVDGGMTIN